MDENNNNRRALLREMHRLAEEVLRLTSALSISGQSGREESDINAYAALIEKREPLIQQLTRLKKQIDLFPAGISDKLYDEEQKATALLVTKIIALDRKHDEVIQCIMISVKKTLKGIKDVKKITHAYAVPTSGYSLLDTKQ